MDFPHIQDTQFPHLNNVDVYKYKNNFDYARWQGKVTYKLLNVKWNSTYNDVPYFDTIEERDEWFDSQTSEVGILETVFNNTPKQKLKVPLPFNDMYHYNYIVIDMPTQTSDDNPLNYANDAMRVERWFYFIEDMNQFAPSTTELEISIDYWTTFIHSVSIPYLMLERGHAPMFQTTVDMYLSNPIENNEYLLADDFNYSEDTIVKTSTYYPIGNDAKYVLFCAPYKTSDFRAFDGTAYSSSATPPTFSDINNRWGYQLQVNGYQWKYGNTDYSDSNVPITNCVQTGIFNGIDCFAIAAEDAYDFFNLCAEQCVGFIHGIQAMFVLAGNLFNRSNPFEFMGYTIYIADRKINDVAINLSKSQFGFPSRYADIAKLYTSPYSLLEVTDDEGNSFTAKIENTGHIHMREEVSLVYPFLNYNVLFNGINGSGEMRYIWKTVQGDNDSMSIWADDFSKYMMNWEIPVYSLFVSAENEYAANNFFGNQAKRAGAIKDYENAVRFANTTYENVDDSYATNTTNVAATGATNTGNTQRTTSKDVSNTAATEATKVSNTADTMGTLIINTGNDNAANTDITNNNNDHNQVVERQSVSKLLLDYVQDNSVTVAGIDATATNMMAGMVSNGISSISSAASSGFNPAGVASAGASFIGAEVSSVVAAGMNVAIANAASAASLEKAQIGGDFIENVNSDLRSTSSANTTRRNRVNMQNAENTRTLNNGNATRTQGTNNANESRNKAAADANAAAIQSTNNANAGRTQTTETNNADYTRDATVAAEKANLVQKQLEVANTYKNARLHEPYKRGEYAGDYFADVYHRRGVRFNVRTQSKSAIAQAGDAMLRFGYALHKVWDMSRGFHYGKQFTFWKAEDIWINDGSGVANIATNAIANILLSGVTVWRDASKIGTVGIYDNI